VLKSILLKIASRDKKNNKQKKKKKTTNRKKEKKTKKTQEPCILQSEILRIRASRKNVTK
jgi:hypothetical protein